MKEQICKHQGTVFETVQMIHISSCKNPESPHYCALVSKLICDNCPLKKAPDAKDVQLRDTLEEVYGQAELEKRTPEACQEILLTYCFKCKFLDPVAKICLSCDCLSQAPIDEYVKYSKFHCPLELW